MTRTPDEIKKGLGDPVPVHFHRGNPEPCLTPLSYKTLEELFADALALIQQLEAERDALMKDLNGACWACKLANVSNGMCVTSGDCAWEWRGVQKEN